MATKTYTTTDENKIKGWKKSKDLVTLILCSNASGKYKLPMVFIHKYENPHCFKGIAKKNLPFFLRVLFVYLLIKAEKKCNVDLGNTKALFKLYFSLNSSFLKSKKT